MWVQDPVVLSTNITAPFTKDEVNKFIKLCQMFVTYKPNFDDALPYLSVTREQINVNQGIEKRIDFRMFFAMMETSAEEGKDHIVFMRIRKDYEMNLINKLNLYLKSFDSNLYAIHFGSSHYGLTKRASDLNLFIYVGKKNFYINFLIKYMINTLIHKYFTDASLTDVVRNFKDYLKASNIQNEFQSIFIVPENRVRKQQIGLIHKKSGLQCFLQFDNDIKIPESSLIIRWFTENVPMCKYKLASKLVLDC